MIFVREAQSSKDIEMQTRASPRHKLVRIAAVAIAGSCAALIAILLDWAPFSIGGASDNPVPVMLSAIPAQTASTIEAPADRVDESRDTPTEPTCAELGGIASTEEPEGFGPRGSVGCDMFSNLAADTRAGNQSDVEAFLAWHLEMRDLIQHAYQTGQWDMREQ
jgi:hypothetical protein